MTSHKRKIILLILGIIIILASALYATTYLSNISKPSMKESPKKVIIIARVVNNTIKCSMEVKYSSEVFNNIASNWSSYEGVLIHEIPVSYVENINVKNISATYIPSNNTVIITWVVCNAIWTWDNKCYATFLWLLKPLNLDLINNKFKASNSGLYWSGEINGVPYEIILVLPKQSMPYKTWGEPVGHCHSHVWWPKKP